MSLLDQRCFQHDGREAVAQCPSCKLFFCRECVTEHDGRMICVTCVNALTRDTDQSERAAKALWTVTALLGLLIAWLVFYYLGLALARIPSKFHSATNNARNGCPLLVRSPRPSPDRQGGDTCGAANSGGSRPFKAALLNGAISA